MTASGTRRVEIAEWYYENYYKDRESLKAGRRSGKWSSGGKSNELICHCPTAPSTHNAQISFEASISSILRDDVDCK